MVITSPRKSATPGIRGEKTKLKFGKLELALLAILILGFSLRVYDLGTESIWLDEAIAIGIAKSSLSGVIEAVSYDIHPPLYHLTLHSWILLFGDSEFSVRFLSVVFGVLAILLLYKVGSRIFDKEVGIISSLLLSVSLFHIVQAQDARPYTMLISLTLLSFYFFLDLLEKRNFASAIGYLIPTALLAYTHFHGWFIILAQNTYIFTLYLQSKDRPRLHFTRWLLVQLALISLFLPWPLTIFERLSFTLSLTSWIPVPTLFSLGQFSLEGTLTQFAGSRFLFAIFGLLAVWAVLTYTWRKKLFKSPTKSVNQGERSSKFSKIYLLLLWFFVPVLLPFAISNFYFTIFLAKYTLAASLAFYLLVSLGIRNIFSKYAKVAIIAILLLLSWAPISGYFSSSREQWRDVAAYIQSEAQAGDLILLTPAYEGNSFGYYFQRNDVIKKGFPTDFSATVDAENIVSLKNIIDGKDRVWVVSSFRTEDRQGLIKKTLSESYDIAYDRGYWGIQVLFFEKSS